MAREPKLAEFVQVLEYYDGPQSVLLRRSSELWVVAVAIDHQSSDTRFFGVNVSCEQWERYLRGYIDFRALFTLPRGKEYYEFDLISDARVGSVINLTSAKREENLINIPGPGFFSYDHSESIASGPLLNVAAQKYKTDGIWALPDFTNFYNKLNDLYSFFFALKSFSSTSASIERKKKIKRAFVHHPLRGGSSYNNLYKELASTLNFDEKIAVGKLQYASPGEVDVRGRFDVFAEIELAHQEFDKNYDALKEEYDDLYKYLRTQKLLRDIERFDRDGPIALRLMTKSKNFANSLHLTDIELIFELTEENSLVFSKILLSYFRRLERYYVFFAEGRVKDPELSQK